MTPYYTHWHPTVFNGIQFKSKLEARWYIVFTHLGLSAVYEPRRFAIPELQHTPEHYYTPDFGLLNMPYPIVEIKPDFSLKSGVITQAVLKLKSVSCSTPCALIIGSCWPGEFDVLFFENGKRIKPKVGAISKVYLALGRSESKSVVALKVLLGGWRGDYMGAFRYSYEVIK